MVATAAVLLLAFLNLIYPSVIIPQTQPGSQQVETLYDEKGDRTTVRLVPVKISGANDKYQSLHMSPSFSYAGRKPQRPEIIDFELKSVVRGRLDTDLYVQFVINGEKIFLSSNRSAIKRPVPGRLWMGERLVFRMPLETFARLANAKLRKLSSTQ